VVDHAGLGVDERVVGGRVQLNFKLLGRQHQVLELGADPLGRCAQCVAVLVQTSSVRVLANDKLRGLEHLEDVDAGLHLTSVRADIGNEWVVVVGRSAHGLGAHSSQDLSRQSQVLSFMQGHCGTSDTDRSAVHQTKTFLGHHSCRCKAGELNGAVCTHNLALAIGHSAVQEDVVVALQGSSNVGQG
jgi:hypothetical protein